MQIATGCTQNTNTQHLHDEAKFLPMDTQLKLHTTQLKQLTQTQTHPLHDLNACLNLPRNMKATILYTNKHTNIIISKQNIATEKRKKKLKYIHTTTITLECLSSRKNKVTNTTPYEIYLSEQTLPRYMRTKVAQLRANKSPLLQSYLHTVNPDTYMPQCPRCFSHTHGTNHLFNCSQLPTQHNPTCP